ncbi:trimethylamine---corrinoid protein Co-methyltransferase [Eubacterium maltosivorans]|uniref:trimethylamine methyltransferase family protein n=1 Tax=Eubacterium maltosivorans TaxID=2041044 RepID=UPI0008877E3F|nr:trimethylamine methyltransferase family protein [Eubacterium maltosivorans]WPK78677.1 Glycine betaine methyltransferase [Eubacterium maltosivorans]SDO42319.1 trimethylamine---corrinoid protein Co-methyltransferase [Eubacterium maltosivorans]
MNLTNNLLSQTELELLHEESLKILENVGVAFFCEEAVEIFRKHGAHIEGETVFINEKMLRNALSTVPKSFEWFGRSSSVVIGNGNTVYAPAYGPMFVLEGEEYRYPTTQDFINFHKLDETSKVMSVGSPNIMDLPSVNASVRSDYAMAATLLYHEKPVLGIVDGKEKALNSIKMTKDFYDVQDKCVLVGLINTASPLHYSQAMGEALIEYAKQGQAVIVSGDAMSGMTTPDTIASCILTVNAEVLAGIVLTQLINPGTPVIYANQGHGSDLRYTVPTLGSPEDALMIQSIKAIGEFYGIPVRTGGCITDAKDADMQAGIESFTSCWATLSARTDLMMHSCGILDSFNSIGYEKYVYDEEIILSVERYLKGYEITEKTLMYDKIAKAGPGGNFISRTSKAYKNDYYLPNIPIRVSHGNWITDGSPTIKEKTAEIYHERLNNYTLPELDKAQAGIIRKYLPEKDWQ